MVTISQSYDHPTYLTRVGVPMGEVGGAATTVYAKFNAFTGVQAYSATLSVTTAGTATNAWVIKQISGTNTVALATATLSNNAAGSVVNVALTTAAGGVLLAQGDLLTITSGADAAGKVAVAYEIEVANFANVTK